MQKNNAYLNYTLHRKKFSHNFQVWIELFHIERKNYQNIYFVHAESFYGQVIRPYSRMNWYLYASFDRRWVSGLHSLADEWVLFIH